VSDFVIVYHRQPFEEFEENGKTVYREHRSPNGIVPTLRGFCRHSTDASWVAWSQVEKDSVGKVLDTVSIGDLGSTLKVTRVGLSAEQVRSFYHVTSKAALWPILHCFPERFDYDAVEWSVFREVNQVFANAACETAAEGAVVWVHDYNLWLVPGMIAEKRPDLRVSFFLHTPFPPPDVFGVLPWREEIIRSLLTCTRVGFHIPRYAENFAACARAFCGALPYARTKATELLEQVGSVLQEPSFVSRLHFEDREICVDAMPIGIDAPQINRYLQQADSHDLVSEIRKQMAVETLIFSVGRIDYTKGSQELLNAFDQLLERRPELWGKVKLCLTSVAPARGMDTYTEIQEEIEQRVGNINGRYSTLGWVPIVLYTRPIPFEELVAWYKAADICWITPVRDGLNLVAKEYVAAHQGQDGVLVLSEFSGVVIELDEAIYTNPYSARSMARSIDRALNMPKEEAQRRMQSMFERVSKHDLHAWTDDMLERLGIGN
jgi:glucosylglycerol-phosphate synthase